MICLVWFYVVSRQIHHISVILWRSVLLVEETEGSGENHQPVSSHWQTLSHNVVHCMFCGSLFVLLLAIVLSVLRFNPLVSSAN